jgi:selenocysteine lyase/cysteine desulfurase
MNGEKTALEFSETDFARKFENSSMNIAGIYALNSGISALMDIGMKNVEAHIGGLHKKLYEGLEELSFKLATPKDRAHNCHSISIVFPDVADAYRFYLDRKVFISRSAGKYIRASIPQFANGNDIERMLEVSREYALRIK